MKRRRKRTVNPQQTLAIVVVVCMLLLGVTAAGGQTIPVLSGLAGVTIIPMQKGINSVGYGIVDWKNAREENKELQQENEELQALVTSLKQENQKMEQDQYRLEELEKLYEIDQKYDNYEKTGANIISKGSGNWFDIFVIDKGSKDGIKKDMNVISGNGLVGIVYEVSDNYSKVRSIINDTSMVSTTVARTHDNCIVKGSTETMEKGYLEVVYLDKDSKIKKGDELVTSSISSKFLEGFTVGTVTKVMKSEDSLTKTARIEPAVDFKHLKEVLVVKTIKNSVNIDDTLEE